MKMRKPAAVKIFVSIFILAGLASIARAMPGCDWFLGVSQRSAGVLDVAKIYFPYFKSIRNFDPHVIHTADTAVLVQNLYSRLFTLDDDGQISGDLAEDIQWNGKSYEIRLRKAVKTIDGKEIGTKDVVASLKRILTLNQTTHGSLRPFLNIEGIQEDGERVILTPLDPNTKSFLVTTLASIDFAILPLGSFDMTKPGWPMTDWKNTSGLYYVAQDSEDGKITLQINPNHHFYTGKQPKTLHLYPGLGQDAVEAFREGKVDIIPTITIAKGSDFLNLPEEANVFKSELIYLTNVRFTTKGFKNLSAKERLKAGLLIKAALLKGTAEADGVAVDEYFPVFSEGALTSEQKTQLQKALNEAQGLELKKKVTFGVYPSKLEQFQALFRDVKEIEVVPTKGVPPWLEPEERQPDVYFAVTDSGFYESLSLLYYGIDQSAFMDREEGLKWLDGYVREPDKAKRIEAFKKLHADFLIQGRIIPISATSYVSVARKPLKPEFSKFYAGTPLWKLTTD